MMHRYIQWDHVNVFALYWAGWLVAFLVPELWAAFNKPSYTLSEEVWSIEHLSMAHPFDVAAWTPLHWVFALLVWGLFGWLSFHLPFGVK